MKFNTITAFGTMSLISGLLSSVNATNQEVQTHFGTQFFGARTNNLVRRSTVEYTESSAITLSICIIAGAIVCCLCNSDQSNSPSVPQPVINDPSSESEYSCEDRSADVSIYQSAESSYEDIELGKGPQQ